MGKSKKKKADFTEYKSSIVKTSWVNVFEPSKKDIADLEKAGKDADKWRRKCTFMFPKSIEAIELKISDEGKEKMVAEGKKFLKAYRDESLKMALSIWEDCASKSDLEEEEIRWNPVLDGDSRKMLKTYAGNAGYYIVRAGTGFDYADKESMPFIYGADNERVYEKGTLRSGDWVRAFLTLYTYHGESNGVTAGMNNIKKCYKGTFTGVQTAEFEDDDELEELETTAEDFDNDSDKVEDEEWED